MTLAVPVQCVDLVREILHSPAILTTHFLCPHVGRENTGWAPRVDTKTNSLPCRNRDFMSLRQNRLKPTSHCYRLNSRTALDSSTDFVSTHTHCSHSLHIALPHTHTHMPALPFVCHTFTHTHCSIWFKFNGRSNMGNSPAVSQVAQV